MLCSVPCVLVPVLVAGDPVGDEGDGLSVTLFVPEAAGQHDEFALQLPDTRRESSYSARRRYTNTWRHARVCLYV